MALDLGLGLRFHPPPTLRYPCSFLLQKGKRLKCLPNAGTGRQIEREEKWKLEARKRLTENEAKIYIFKQEDMTELLGERGATNV